MGYSAKLLGLIVATAIVIVTTLTSGCAAETQSNTDVLLKVEDALDDEDYTLQGHVFFDIHTFEGIAGQLIEVRVESNDLNPSFSVLGPKEETFNELALVQPDSSDMHSSGIVTLPRDGTYAVVVVSDGEPKFGQYRLILTTQADADIE